MSLADSRGDVRPRVVRISSVTLDTASRARYGKTMRYTRPHMLGRVVGMVFLEIVVTSCTQMS